MAVEKLTKPKPFYKKRVKPKIGQLYTVLTDAVVDTTAELTSGKTGIDETSFVKAIATGVKGLLKLPTAFELEKDGITDIAWRLVFTGLSNAVSDLIADYAPALMLSGLGTSKKDIDLELESWIESKKGEDEIAESFDSRFFTRPGEIPFISAVSRDMERWFVANGAKKQPAKSVAEKLGSFFTICVMREWQRDPVTYSPLRYIIDHPFVSEERRIADWERYHARICREVEESLLGEPFGLEDVYVWPRGIWVEHIDPEGDELRDEPRVRLQDKHATTTHVMWLKEELWEWAHNWPDPDAPKGTTGYGADIRVISGEPGVGKSAFGRMFAKEIAAEVKSDIRVLFVGLHDFNLTGTLREAVAGYANDQGISTNPVDAEQGEDKLLIIFDGLDELHQGGSGKLAEDFVNYLTGYTTNVAHRRVKFLLSGRIPIIQEHERRFREKNQVLEILPYWNEEWENKGYKDPNKLLAGKDADQRSEFWCKFCEKKNKRLSTFDKILRNDILYDLTRRPLLNTMISITHARTSLKLDKPEFNRNTVYNKLLVDVFQRSYEHEHQHPGTKDITFAQFEHMLEVVAEIAWHKGARGASIEDIEVRCEHGDGKLSEVLDKMKGLGGASKLMLSFFFKKQDDQAGSFSFTHKSFSEYLVARRLLHRLEKLLLDREIEGNKKTMIAIAELLGPSRITLDIREFIIDELNLWKSRNKFKKVKFQPDMVKLIEYSLQNEVPVTAITPSIDSYRELHAYAVHTIENLFIIHSLFVKSLKEREYVFIKWINDWLEIVNENNSVDNIEYSNIIKDYTLINVITSSQTIYDQSIGIWLLSHLDLRYVWLYRAWLVGADLSCSNMSHAVMMRAVLEMTNLNYSILRGTDLMYASLFQASMIKADLSGADLMEADLSSANMKGANLKGADLNGADLRGADMREVDLNEANLRRIKIYKSDVQDHWDLSEDELEKRGVQIYDDLG